LAASKLLVGLIPCLLWAQVGDGGRGSSGEVRFTGENEQGCEECLWLKDSSLMVVVPASEFVMGSNDGDMDERPIHRVYLDEYYIDKCEVTNRQYKQFCDATGRRYPEDPGWEGMSGYFTSRPSYPVVNVSWEDATAYCAWVGKRPPTEAEWEKAARGTGAPCNFADRNTYYSWSARDVDDGYARTAPVGSFPGGASPYGCLDMAGNVWEWCNDWYDADYYRGSVTNNPPGRSSGSVRVLRGGSWKSGVAELRSAYRSSGAPSGWCDDLGFRCAASVSERTKAPDGNVVGRQPKPKEPLHPVPEHQAGTGWVSAVPFEEVEVKPRLLNLPVPEYPDMARTAGIEGQAIVEALIDVSGSVADARILKSSGNMSLDKAGLEAALRAKFIPGQQGGRRVPVRLTIPFRFTLR